MDRRQRKTRAAVRAALLDQLTDKAFDAITVEDIITTADIARATFYAHYSDKHELLLDATRELVGELREQMLTITDRSTGFTGGAVRVLFEHAAARPRLYRALIAGEGGPDARAVLTESLIETATTAFTNFARSQRRTPRLPIAVVATTFVGAGLANLEAWLGGRLRGTASHVANQFLETQIEGTAVALGFAPGETLQLDAAAHHSDT